MKCVIRFLTACLASSLASAARPASAGLAHVEARSGVIHYFPPIGTPVQVTARGGQEPALSPDGLHIAFIQAEEKGSALWTYDTTPHKRRRLLRAHPTEDNKTNLRDLHSPVFSLRGDFIYVQSAAWVTSDALFRVDAKSGAHRYVGAGNSLVVVRDGPYAGDLIVSRHTYRPAGGAYEQLVLLQPDGTEILRIPGSSTDTDDSGPWLIRHHWQAW
jgi:Tol biopolymer transport system component